jgi:hypothetical protein
MNVVAAKLFQSPLALGQREPMCAALVVLVAVLVGPSAFAQSSSQDNAGKYQTTAVPECRAYLGTNLGRPIGQME